MMFDTTPQFLAERRERTNKSHAKMAGASFLSFWCGDCNSAKPVSGRKSRGYKMGFRCACCVAKKAA